MEGAAAGRYAGNTVRARSAIRGLADTKYRAPTYVLVMDDYIPETQPSGALVPPNKPPGTAVATSAPLPPSREPLARTLRDSNVIRRFLSRTFDVVDEVADAVAGGLGLRHP